MSDAGSFWLKVLQMTGVLCWGLLQRHLHSLCVEARLCAQTFTHLTGWGWSRKFVQDFFSKPCSSHSWGIKCIMRASLSPPLFPILLILHLVLEGDNPPGCGVNCFNCLAFAWKMPSAAPWMCFRERRKLWQGFPAPWVNFVSKAIVKNLGLSLPHFQRKSVTLV